MTFQVAVVLAVLVLAMALLAIERIPMEVSALAVVALLALSGVVTPEQAFAGFGDDIVIFIFTLLAMTQGLASTGVVQLVGQRLASFARLGQTGLVAALMSVTAAFSSSVSDTVTTAAFLPVGIGAADRAGVPRSRVLMPIAFAALLGGTIFVIGTSTNLVVSAVLQKNGMAPIGFAELTPVGVPFTVIGIAVVSLLARWLLPDRSAEEAADDAVARAYLAEIRVPPGSRYAGAPLDELTTGVGLRVLAAIRDGATMEPAAGLGVEAGDVLVVEEDRLDLLRVKDLRGLEMVGDAPRPAEGAEEDVVLAEATVQVGSSLVGRSLAEAFFAEHFGLAALAISRRPAIQRLTRAQLVGGLFGTQSLATLPLAVGDVLLLRGPRARLRALSDGRTLSLLGSVEYQPVRSRKAAIAVAIFLGVLAICILRLAPYSVAGLCGLIAMIATRCVDARVAFRVDWRVLVLIASMMALGTAMETSGTGRYLASLIVPLAHHFGPRAVLVALMLITVVVSTPMSNQAAALVLLPVAFGVAQALRLNPRTFAMGVCLAASCSFLFPMEPACVLVYAPGRYRFFDYTRLGAPLTVILIGLLTFIVPWRWPF